MAVAMIAATALITETNLVLQWNNAAAMFDEPVTANIGVVLLSHHLGYFDILPLYIVLMSMAPAMAILYRYSPGLAARPLRLGLRCDVIHRIQPAHLAGRGPLVLQPVRMAVRLRHRLHAGRRWPAPALGPQVSASAANSRRPVRPLRAVLAALYGWYPDWLSAPEPAAFFVVDKTFQTPLRLLHVLALMALFGGSFLFYYEIHDAQLRGSARCWGGTRSTSSASAPFSAWAGQIVRFAFPESLWVDTAVLIVGLIALSITAWVSEWRQRLRA